MQALENGTYGCVPSHWANNKSNVCMRAGMGMCSICEVLERWTGWHDMIVRGCVMVCMYVCVSEC